eukprot:1161319-Pelagomonas_calceolata.AAC.13
MGSGSKMRMAYPSAELPLIRQVQLCHYSTLPAQLYPMLPHPVMCNPLLPFLSFPFLPFLYLPLKAMLLLWRAASGVCGEAYPTLPHPSLPLKAMLLL